MPFVALDSAQREPLHRQLYDSIRAAIVSGRLPAGSRLPSSRALAEVALASGVVTTPLSSYRLPMAERDARGSARARGALLFGYAGYPETTIWEAARRMEQAMSRMPMQRSAVRGS